MYIMPELYATLRFFLSQTCLPPISVYPHAPQRSSCRARFAAHLPTELLTDLRNRKGVINVGTARALDFLRPGLKGVWW